VAYKSKQALRVTSPPCYAIIRVSPHYRVWKGILGIRDLTIRCGIQENEKYLEGIQDLTATKEAGFTKIWVQDAGFCCLSVGNSGNRHDPKKPL